MKAVRPSKALSAAHSGSSVFSHQFVQPFQFLAAAVLQYDPAFGNASGQCTLQPGSAADFLLQSKEVNNRIWNVEDLIKDSDIVVGIGRSAMVGMACGKCVISWDNRSLNLNTGCGYIIPKDFFSYAYNNFTGRGYNPIDTVDKLKNELLKYKPEDGKVLRMIAEQHLNADINSRICIEVLNNDITRLPK